MLIYQRHNSQNADHIETDLYTDFQFLPHLHRDLEFALLIEGALEVFVGGRTEIANRGDIALIFSNQIHSYRTPRHSKVLVCPFSGSFVSDFVGRLGDRVGEKSVFPGTPELCAYVESCFPGGVSPDKLTATATLYAICARFLSCVPLRAAEGADGSALHALLCYVEEHYRENITIREIAREIGFNESYLSRYFHGTTGMNFRRYLNQYRVDYARRMIASGEKKISDIALESGFQNIRSFNRAFRDAMGESPSGYMHAR